MSLFDRFGSKRELEEEVIRLRREILALERTSCRTGSSGSLLTARALRDARSIEAFSDAALPVVIDVAGAETGALVLPDDEGSLRPVAVRCLSGRAPLESFVMSHGIAAEAARDGQPIATGSAFTDARFRASQSVLDHKIGSVLCLPVRRAAAPAGCIYLTAAKQGLRRADPVELLAIADIFSVALDRLAADAEISRRERLEAIGFAAASISHDLKTPIAAADLALEAARTRPERTAGALDAAKHALARASELASGFASFARGVERTLELQPLPLAALLDEHAREVAPILEQARVSTDRELAYDGPVLVDRSSILRILGNLARNGAEACAAGGRIVYRSKLIPPDRAELAVSDDGRGIAPEHLRKLFRPFFTFGKAGGCGLGLALAQDLARAMGGSIRAESVLGRGTTMRLGLRVG